MRPGAAGKELFLGTSNDDAVPKHVETEGYDGEGGQEKVEPIAVVVVVDPVHADDEVEGDEYRNDSYERVRHEESKIDENPERAVAAGLCEEPSQVEEYVRKFGDDVIPDGARAPVPAHRVRPRQSTRGVVEEHLFEKGRTHCSGKVPDVEQHDGEIEREMCHRDAEGAPQHEVRRLQEEVGGRPVLRREHGQQAGYRKGRSDDGGKESCRRRVPEFHFVQGIVALSVQEEASRIFDAQEEQRCLEHHRDAKAFQSWSILNRHCTTDKELTE